MAKPLHALPRTVTLPFGYVVKIKLASAKECKELESPEMPTMYGWWDSALNTIYIRSTLKPAQKRYILAHEMHHALLDWMHEMLDGGVMQATKG